MIKMIAGRVRNSETGAEKDIAVKAAAPNDLKDILIGVGTVMVGITYLTVTAFKKGAWAYESAEVDALRGAGIIKKEEGNTTTQKAYNFKTRV